MAAVEPVAKARLSNCLNCSKAALVCFGICVTSGCGKLCTARIVVKHNVIGNLNLELKEMNKINKNVKTVFRK